MSAERFSKQCVGLTVRIEVGDPLNTRTFDIHEQALNISPYFRTCLSGKWKEGNNGPITLHGIQPAIFECVIEWLYSGTLSQDVYINGKSSLYAYPLIYECGRRFLLSKLQNDAIDALRKRAREDACSIDAETAASIYEHSEETSAFRKLVSSSIAYDVLSKKSNGLDQLVDAHPDIAADALKTIAAATSAAATATNGGGKKDDKKKNEGGFIETPFGQDRWDECRYHDHAEGEGCEAVKTRRAMRWKTMSMPK